MPGPVEENLHEALRFREQGRDREDAGQLVRANHFHVRGLGSFLSYVKPAPGTRPADAYYAFGVLGRETARPSARLNQDEALRTRGWRWPPPTATTWPTRRRDPAPAAHPQAVARVAGPAVGISGPRGVPGAGRAPLAEAVRQSLPMTTTSSSAVQRRRSSLGGLIRTP
ncbi:hypothetical protein SUDANB58_00446 [Streptomyces sp. enrichment culture]